MCRFCLVGWIILPLLSSALTMAADFSEPNRVLREGAIAYGNAQFDPETKLVRRIDAGHNALDVCQHSLEYAAALLDDDQQTARANEVLAAVLTHQDVDPKSPTFGNFRWWHGETQVRDRNAVAFMTPWLAYLAIEHDKELTGENRGRLRKAMEKCIAGVRAHRSGPDYTNIWLLKAASMVMLARALGDDKLEADGATRLDQWIEYTASNGVSEYNSPCYGAVDVYALEWIYHYASDAEIRRKAAGCLDYLYADIFQQWHWEAGIGAGPHSRAYERDRDSGRSLVSCLVFKQCGQPLRPELRSFLYVFAVNDYPVPEPIRAAARKQGRLPLTMRYRILRDSAAVDCRVYVAEQFSLGTQTGRRPVHNDRPLWDIPLKITYAGTRTDRRASYLSPCPTTKHATVASLQHGPAAIVLYEVDLKGSRLGTGRMRLDIEPSEGGMCDEIVVGGGAYDRKEVRLDPGSVLGWRVGETLVALRLLQSHGLDGSQSDRVGTIAYLFGPMANAGLCLDCPLADVAAGAVGVDNLRCGFAIACSTTRDHTSLATFIASFAEWKGAETGSGAVRTVDWRTPDGRLRIEWDAQQNRVVHQAIDGRPVDTALRYDSPLIRLTDGQAPAARAQEPAGGQQ